MKTIRNLGIIAALAGSLFLASCDGEYYVAEQPVEPVYERPAPPYEGAIWVDGGWHYRGGRYVYRRGYYTRPRRGRAYVSGSWSHTSRGYTWHKGHWKR
ncbi:MAG TPA: hypothetical protein VHA56_16455 [Mucilaginibacter sp.]|nr:hypothetical protein [Mucilaginibacter sp.]